MRTNAMLGLLLSAVAQGIALKPAQQNTLNQIVAGLPTSDGKTRRGKRHMDKPAKRTNRSNISARVRRKHRRAA